MTLAAELLAANGEPFLPSERVRTPRGIGRVVRCFPATLRPRMSIVTVRLARHALPAPFYVREVSHPQKLGGMRRRSDRILRRAA